MALTEKEKFDAFAKLAAKRSESWDKLRDALLEYFLVYGVDDDVAWEKANSIIDDDIDEVIEEHGTGLAFDDLSKIQNEIMDNAVKENS